MDESRIREILKLDAQVKVTDEHRAQALAAVDAENKALKEAAAKATAPAVTDDQVVVAKAEHAELLKLRDAQKGHVMLTADEHRKLKEDAEAGRRAEETLKLKEREEIVDAGIRALKVTPAEREDLLALAALDLPRVKGMIERRSAMKAGEVGHGADPNLAITVETVKAFIVKKEAEYTAAPLQLAAVDALKRAQAEAKKEFGPEKYDQYRYASAA